MFSLLAVRPATDDATAWDIAGGRRRPFRHPPTYSSPESEAPSIDETLFALSASLCDYQDARGGDWTYGEMGGRDFVALLSAAALAASAAAAAGEGAEQGEGGVRGDDDGTGAGFVSTMFVDIGAGAGRSVGAAMSALRGSCSRGGGGGARGKVAEARRPTFDTLVGIEVVPCLAAACRETLQRMVAAEEERYEGGTVRGSAGGEGEEGGGESDQTLLRKACGGDSGDSGDSGDGGESGDTGDGGYSAQQRWRRRRRRRRRRRVVSILEADVTDDAATGAWWQQAGGGEGGGEGEGKGGGGGGMVVFINWLTWTQGLRDTVAERVTRIPPGSVLITVGWAVPMDEFALLGEYSYLSTMVVRRYLQ